MTPLRLNPRDLRALLLGAAILVPSLGWIYGVRPYRAALAGMRDRLTAEQEAFAREQAAVSEVARDPARKRTADSAIAAVRPRVFDGANDVAAGAALATWLGEVARRTNVWLANAVTRTAPVAGRGGAAAVVAPPADGLRPLRVEIRAESDFQGVLEFLDALERGEKVVVVERLDVARAIRAGEEDRETLAMTATIVGYALEGDGRRGRATSEERSGDEGRARRAP
jgi:hypothetical protein